MEMADLPPGCRVVVQGHIEGVCHADNKETVSLGQSFVFRVSESGCLSSVGIFSPAS